MTGYRTINNERYDVNLAEQLAKCEEENSRLIREKNEVMRDFNTRMMVHLEEIRLLKEVNEGLQTDLEELRDLCCYLDDDRHKCRKLAREWQNFGRYVSSTLQSKETSFQEEVNSFNLKQETIVAENYNLKRLCQDLEKRSNGYNPPREFVCSRCSQRISLESKQHEVVLRKRPVTDSPTEIINHSSTEINFPKAEERYPEEYSPVFSPDGNIFLKVSSGTRRKKKVSFADPDETVQCDDDKPKHVPFNTESNGPKENICHGILRKRSHSNDQGSSSSVESDSSVNNMNRAMQVLEIHSELEDERHKKQKDPLKDKEVAVLQEMCNVAWRKLSNDGASNGTTENNTLTHDGFADDVIYEDLL